METIEEIIAKCEALGHTMKNDPPMGLTVKTRISCSDPKCGRSALRAAGGDHWYGSALTYRCGSKI